MRGDSLGKEIEMKEWFSQKFTKDQSRDTGMAMVLLLLLAYIPTRRFSLVISAMALHILNMIVPAVYRPVAMVWLGLSHVLGAVVSRLLLTVVFCCIVTPIGLIRRLLGKDTLRLREFKKGKVSVMAIRNHTFTAVDLGNPF
jgi:hypothetical protein